MLNGSKGLDFKHNSSDDTLSLNLTNKINALKLNANFKTALAASGG